MKAPTFAGRRLMDQVEGFKLFLGAVDGDRLNRAAPPQQTPQTFEKFLPYALALDVEQDWAEKFSGVLSQAGTSPSSSGSSYVPSFYSGASSGSFTGAAFASSFGNSLASAISSSHPPRRVPAVGVAEEAQEAAGVAEAEGAGEQRVCGNCGIYREPTRCTLNVSPRGHFTLFFTIKFAYAATDRSTRDHCSTTRPGVNLARKYACPALTSRRCRRVSRI